jgi:uncharacterized membrane protein
MLRKPAAESRTASLPAQDSLRCGPMMTASRVLLAVVMVFAGVMHFVAPAGYARIVPRSLPAPRTLVLVSGVFEVLGGVGLLLPATRHLAAWGLIALFIAVFPANVNMAVNRIGFGRKPPPSWLLWARLPFQGVLIAWAYAFT